MSARVKTPTMASAANCINNKTNVLAIDSSSFQLPMVKNCSEIKTTNMHRRSSKKASGSNQDMGSSLLPRVASAGEQNPEHISDMDQMIPLGSFGTQLKDGTAEQLRSSDNANNMYTASIASTLLNYPSQQHLHQQPVVTSVLDYQTSSFGTAKNVLNTENADLAENIEYTAASIDD